MNSVNIAVLLQDKKYDDDVQYHCITVQQAYQLSRFCCESEDLSLCNNIIIIFLVKFIWECDLSGWQA